jgi:hypothetical protein
VGPEYRNFFQERVEKRRNPSRRVRELAHGAVEDAESRLLGERNTMLRPDARLLMELNLAGMYIDPVLGVQGPRDEQAVVQDAHIDAYAMASAAADEADTSTVGLPEVSGRGVIDAVSRTWSKLRVATMEWE